MTDERLTNVLEKIDRLNSEDPVKDEWEGHSFPHELMYSKQLTEWVLRLDPKASEHLRIAARGQHVRRWTIPRDRYDAGRGGYLRWREDLKKFHAETVAGLMREEGYPEPDIERVVSIIRKRNPQENREAQVIEDALCLVFLESQFDDLRGKTPDEKMREIVRKTWKKMSEDAKGRALRLPLREDQLIFIKESLSLDSRKDIGNDHAARE